MAGKNMISSYKRLTAARLSQESISSSRLSQGPLERKDKLSIPLLVTVLPVAGYL